MSTAAERTTRDRAVGRQRLRATLGRLRVSAPHDALERAADEIADRVVAMPDPGPSLAVSPGRPDTVPRQVTEHRGGRQQIAAPTALLDVATTQAVLRERGGGQHLPPVLCADFTARLGSDLTATRLHTGPRAAALARTVSARAFSVGQDIFFAAGAYRPDTVDGRRLLAHELVHTLQRPDTTGARRGAVRPYAATLLRQRHAPKEPPLLAPSTVERARILKRDVDRQTESLVSSALRLSEVATPVIDRFTRAHQASQVRIEAILKPWLPPARIDFGLLTSVAIGLSLLPIPARAFAAVAKEIVVGVTSSKVGGAVTEAQKADKAARDGLMMARWLSGTQPVAEAVRTARLVVVQNYDTAAQLQLAVLRPWTELLDAEDRGDEKATYRAAAAFVAVAPTFLREAPLADQASRRLVLSYAIADLDNGAADEVRRKMAVILPDVLADLSDRKGVIGLQGADARGDFIDDVLVHFFEEVRPTHIGNQAQSRHSVAEIRDMIRSGSDLLPQPSRVRLAPVMEYKGIAIETRYGYAYVLEHLHRAAEQQAGASLPTVEESITRGLPWVHEPSVILTHFIRRSVDERAATALDAATRTATAAREHWGRMAGVVPD